VHEFRANDLYDPDYAIGGHQPAGFDQLMAQYYHFTVLHSHIAVELLDTIENINTPLTLFVEEAAGQLAATYAAGGANGLMEITPRSQSMLLTNCNYLASSRTISQSLDMSKVFHKTPASMIGDTPYSGDVGHSPVEDVYFALAYFHPKGTAVNYSDASVRITLTYYAVFSEPRQLVGS